VAFRSLNVAALGLKAPLSHATEVTAGDRLIFVSGLTAKTPDGGTYAPGDAGAQATRILESIADVLAEAGGTMADIVKLTVYLCDMGQVGAVSAARAAFFAPPYPASTMLEVSRLVAPDQLVEIEAVAAVPPRADDAADSAAQKQRQETPPA
jgi:2-iminobutanoate/2-iminopropanoate deaminase